MAIALADEEDISLVLANDPDADRFCAAERSSIGKWHIFTGNEMGIILAHHVLSLYRRQPEFNLRILPIVSVSNVRKSGNVVVRGVVKNVSSDGREGRVSS